MELVGFSEIPARKFDAFLGTQTTSLIYHSTPFLEMLTKLLRCRHRGVVAIEGGEIVGYIPLMEIDGPYGRVINSLPFFGSHGGIASPRADVRLALGNYYQSLLSEPGLASATVIANPLEPTNSLDGIGANYFDYRTGQLTFLDLSKSEPQALMELIHSKTRNMIRKAQSLGVTVRLDNTALPALTDLHLENMHRIGGLPKPLDFFDLVPKMFIESREWSVFTGHLDGKVIAALLVFYFNGIAEYFTPGVSEQYRSTQALSLVVFEAIRDAAKRGMRLWNWGGTWPSQETVYRFKSRWGTIDFPYEYRTTVIDRRLLNLTPGQVLKSYPYFFVLPFGALKSDD
jgi:hypothetical protein